MNYSKGVQRGETGGSGGDGGGDGRWKKKRQNAEKKTAQENDIVIHPTLCRKLRLKDAKLEARRLPRVR